MNERQQPCAVWSEAISLLAAEGLTEPEKASLERHLAGCPGCRERAEEVTSICSSLRAAKPLVDQQTVLKIAGCLQHPPMPAQGATVRSRSVSWRVAILATAAMVLICLVSQFTPRRTTDRGDQSMVRVQVQPQAAPLRSTDRQLPNLSALSRAAAESDESFDRLLALYSEPSVLEPLYTHTFRWESWP